VNSYVTVIPAEAGHEVKLFSTIQVVNPTIWIPAFAGMTSVGFLPGISVVGFLTGMTLVDFLKRFAQLVL
jgi:hypothetical protein